METDLKELEHKLSSSQDSSVRYEDVLPVVETIQDSLSYAWGVAGHLKSVQNSDEIRSAYEENQSNVVKGFTSFSQSKPLYDALTKLEQQNNNNMENTSQDQQTDFQKQQQSRALSNAIRSMKLGGVGLEGSDKERFNEIKLKLADIQTQFSNNILDATKAFALTIDDPASIEGVPQSSKGMWAQNHEKYINEQKQKEEKGNDGDNEDGTTTADPIVIDPDVGPWRITLDGPSYIAAMQFLPDRQIREQIYGAYNTRASENENNNVPLINEILSLRAEQSNLLGFDTYCERSLASKMAGSFEDVETLSDLIASKALPAAAKELEAITDYAKKNGGKVYEELEKLMPWDITFWSERYKEETFAITKEQLRPYFALPNVLDGLFSLANRLFGIVIQSADGEAQTWNEDVRFFKVYDEESGKHIASFFLDAYSRPANKQGGAWMGSCIGKSEACKRDIPVAYLNCNNSPPIGKNPSLMTFEEVRTLFHEFGHGLQHMLTTAEVGDVAGISGVEWDAVELPSQFMENWLYDKSTMYGFAKHYETGEPLPEELYGKLLQQKTFNAGLYLTRQLYLGQLDMALHNGFDPSNGDETIFDIQKKMAAKYIPHNPPVEGDRFLCSFSHIFAGGYSAGYYSYKWAEVMSADAFGAFEDAGLDDEEEVKRVGRKFRDTVLSLGGSVHPTEVFTSFRGREPTPDALLRHNGMA